MSKIKTDIYPLIALGGIAFVLYKFGDGVANMFGGGSKATNVQNKLQQRNIEDRANDPWSPEYLSVRLKKGGNKKYYLLQGAAVNKFIKEIQSTGGFWRLMPETGDALTERFQTLSHKTQVSYLATQFKKQTGKDLLTYIKNKMQSFGWLSAAKRNENLADLLDFVNRLPE